MSKAVSDERTQQHTSFLLDGLCVAPSPVLLIVAELSIASELALAVHQSSEIWNERPSRVGRLLRVDTDRILEATSADRTNLLDELAAADHWIFLPDVGSLLKKPNGRAFLEMIVDTVASGQAAALIASTRHYQLDQLQRSAPRLMGFASAVHSGGESEGSRTFCRTIVVHSSDPVQVGWLVIVRYVLRTAIVGNEDQVTTLTDGRLRLVDSIHMVVEDGLPPVGVMIGLAPSAFTVSQEDAAFATAEVAATRLVGRPLGRGEQICATRAIFYA